jgi:hypothetical protein
MLPEITTLRPSVEGFGEEAIVSPDAHPAAAQHGVVVPQHGVEEPEGQHAADGQQASWAPDLCAPWTGVGQQGTIPARCGQAMAGDAPAAPAAPAGARTQIEASRTNSDEYETIERRIPRCAGLDRGICDA